MSTINNYSPLRYPGGKAAIAGFFSDLLLINGITKEGTYCEPFAGGAGVALTLLLTGNVRRIIINDIDICISSFWRSLLFDPQRFLDAIKKCEISMKEWEEHRYIYNNAKNIDINRMDNMFKLGFSTFFLNRTNRSGILPKAGPIGGRKQTGSYKLDIRFKKDVLINRIKMIISVMDNIIFTSLDAIEFMRTVICRENNRENLFVYLDPPYYHRGKDLYLNFYTHNDHIMLAHFMDNFDHCMWMMTYDDCDEIREIYKSTNIKLDTLTLRYALHNKRASREIMLFPSNVIIPTH